MSRARFFRPVQDALGNIVAGGAVRVYDAATGTPFMDPIWSDAAGTTSLTAPWTVGNGVIDFYIDKPQFLTIGYTPVGAAEILFPFQAIYAPGFYVMNPTFTNPGVLAAPYVGSLPIYVKDDMFIEEIFASLGTSPVGAPVIVDILVNGTSVFTNPLNRPTLNPGDTTVTVIPDLPIILGAQKITMDLVEVGSTFPGSDLTVQVWARQQSPVGVL